MQKEKKSKLLLIEGSMSIVLNLLLFVLKYWAGVVTGSIAIIADAWHTLSDSLSSLIVIIGAKVSNKPADKDHPFGHGRADVISAFIIGILLVLVAFDFILKSIDSFNNHNSSTFGTIAIIVMIISVVLKELMAQYALWAYRKTNSSVLKADAWHHRSDAISSMVILTGIFLSPYFWWIDSVLGFIVAILIAYAAYEILRDSIHSLMGENIDLKTLDDIKDICKKSYPENIYPHHFHLHKYGEHIEVTFHIILNKDMSINDSHVIAKKIKLAIKEELNFHSTIHIQPEKHK